MRNHVTHNIRADGAPALPLRTEGLVLLQPEASVFMELIYTGRHTQFLTIMLILSKILHSVLHQV